MKITWKIFKRRQKHIYAFILLKAPSKSINLENTTRDDHFDYFDGSSSVKK